MNITYITITGKEDGFGAQYQAVMSGIAFCKYNNYVYIHTPFKKMNGHNIDNNEVNKLNTFIGINNEYLKKKNLLPSNNDIIIEKKYTEVHNNKTPSIYYTHNVLDIIRNYYFSTEKPIIDNIDIAIHIRRGDVKFDNIKRHTDNNFYVKIIQELRNKYPFYKITIFSEGDYEEFRDIGLEENCYKLNIDICETFHSLVCSKVLIMAKSSFSYSAALLNVNTIYYIDFWHKKLNHWLNIESLLDHVSVS
jgi:hypothetical protein